MGSQIFQRLFGTIHFTFKVIQKCLNIVKIQEKRKLIGLAIWNIFVLKSMHENKVISDKDNDSKNWECYMTFV